MELKNYQVAALDAFVRWRDVLAEAQAKSETAIAALESVNADVPEDTRNYPKSAWQTLEQSGGVAESAGTYTSRTDDAGRPIPHVCFKVPTGGGKTLLAAAALKRLNRQSGLTLWITPTRAIYEQTKAALRTRDHPYRQMLEQASGGRVKLLEKDDPFTRPDVANYLCVMLLMLPAANRQKGREFLRMFRDSGRYPTLFPDSDDALGDAKLLLSDSAEFQRIPFRRREAFRHKDIFLPLVLHKDGSAWDELDYQRHILSGIEWTAIESPDPQSSLPERARWQWATVDVGEALPVFHADRELYIDKTVRLSWYARRLADLIPNPWQASRISRQFVDKLRAAGQSDDDIHDRRSYLAFALREHVTRSVETQAEAVFKHKLGAGDIRFDLQAGQPNFRMVDTYELPAAGGLGGLLARRDHQPMQISLFEPVFERQFDNELERNFARYLDEQKALQWWHRVAVRQSGDYYLRGWKQDRIWPDFVAMSVETAGKSHVLVFETKGDHLRGNPDTDYKQRVMETLEDAFNCGTMTVRNGPARGTFRLVFNDAQFPEVLADVAANH